MARSAAWLSSGSWPAQRIDFVIPGSDSWFEIRFGDIFKGAGVVPNHAEGILAYLDAKMTNGSIQGETAMLCTECDGTGRDPAEALRNEGEVATTETEHRSPTRWAGGGAEDEEAPA